jgi:glycosyltransferase involved in cell wall biosynthesis
MKILLLPATLRAGGTERQAANLAKALYARGHDVLVAVPYDGDRYQSELEAAGVRVVTTLSSSEPVGRWAPKRLLNMWLRFWRTFRLIHRERSEVIYSFGNFINLYASLVAMTSRAPLLWGIRDSRPGPPKGFWLAERVLVRKAALAIANSQAGKQSWIKRGLPSDKILVIPNGIDMEKFTINDHWRSSIRHKLDVSSSQKLVGIIGRTHPVKDHELFLRAAKEVSVVDTSARFAIIGASTPAREAELRKLCLELGIHHLVIWVGPTDFVERHLNALDVCVSCSITEGFSNVLVEAMACGVPCVSTDVGDARFTLGELGEVVAGREPSALADAIICQLARSASVPREEIRNSVMNRFSLSCLVDRTEHALREVLVERRNVGNRF